MNLSVLKIRNNGVFVIAFSLIISENYFFFWNSRFFMHPSYLLFNTLFLFIFSIIFFLFLINTIHQLIKKSKIKEFLLIIILSFIMVKLVETVLFYSNTITLSAVFEKFFLLIAKNYILISFLKKLSPYLVVFLVIILLLKQKIIFLQRFIFSFSIIFFILLIYSLSVRYYNYEKVDVKVFEKSLDRKVIWILLDEFDPLIASKNENLLINYKKLKKKSFFLQNSYSPSSHTIESMPSIFMSRDIKEIKYSKNNLYYTDNFNREIHFNFQNTFLKNITKNKLNYKLYSEVLPYCVMLGLENNCKENKNKFLNYFDGIFFMFSPLPYIKKIMGYYTKFEKFDLKKLQKFNGNHNIDSKFILSEKLKFNIETFEKELASENNFIFIHLFLPKENVVASEYVERFYNMSSKNNYEKYQMMLHYTDLIIKGITELIEKNKNEDMMIIFSSDHWHRASYKEIKPSLFISKIFNDDEQIIIDKKLMNIFIPELILKYLNQEINKHTDINKFIGTLKELDVNLIKNNLK